MLRGEGGADWLVGGTAADLLLGGADNDTVNGFHGDDTLDGGEGNDRLVGGLGNDLLLGGAGDDVLIGNAGDDTLDPGAGTDRADGGAGNDLYRVAATDLTSADLISDESGAADALIIRDVFDTLAGAFAGFSFSGPVAGRVQGIERFEFGSGNDVFLPGNMTGDSAGANVVTVSGGAGNDLLNVSQVARLTTPLAFLLDGGDGADSLVGGRGADTISTGTGDDRATGGIGNDLFLVLAGDFTGADTLNGEDGFDRLRFIGNEAIGPAAFANVSGIEVIELDQEGQQVTLPGAFPDGLVGGQTVNIRGGAGDDLIDVSAFASNRRVVVELGAGNDTLFGGAGEDKVSAGAGVDEIHVGNGLNQVTFGPGELSGLDIVTAGTGAPIIVLGIYGDTLKVGVAAGQTLTQGVFAGVSGFDSFLFEGGANSAVRLPSTLVSQSGQAKVEVTAVGDGMVVDGRALLTGIEMNGSGNAQVLFGGSGADTLFGSGDDMLIGGPGGDRIFLLGGGRTAAVIRAVSDGTADINSIVSTAGADSVSGTEFDGNFIMVDTLALGRSPTFIHYVANGANLNLNASSNVLPTQYEIAGDAFGSLTAVRNAVGARLVDNDPRLFEKLILVIGGASNDRFGVYYFEDRDHNATVDSTDILRLLAIGTGDVPVNDDRGFRQLNDFDLV